MIWTSFCKLFVVRFWPPINSRQTTNHRLRTALLDFEFFFAKMLLSRQDFKIMIGKDDKQEEVSFKVADRRKFNADGSLKEGVTLEPAKAPEPQPERPADTGSGPVAAPAAATASEPGPTRGEPVDEHGDDGDIPGADDPASFVNFLSTLATNAVASLGAPHPATGQRSLDLESAKYWLDVLAMLRDKTKGNLHPQESRLLEGILGDLRMQYVQIVRATEEKLKAQAAQKFSGADILGKK
jgi:hypothetical protein